MKPLLCAENSQKENEVYEEDRLAATWTVSGNKDLKILKAQIQ